MRVNAKWGFGNAPLKVEHIDKTVTAIQALKEVFQDSNLTPSDHHLDAISHIKGQFSRTFKQDQWDWSTVWLLLGRPSTKPAQNISHKLGELRRSYTRDDLTSVKEIIAELENTQLFGYLDTYLVQVTGNQTHRKNVGYIYVLSTRENPTLLKIGMTDRSVIERVKEINSATGVVIPFGVRGVWAVRDAAKAERDIHELLSEFRIRSDREFFELEFSDAKSLINTYFKKMKKSVKEEN